MNFIGIDIGSTGTKVAVRGDMEFEFLIPTGWNSKETAILAKSKLLEKGIEIGKDTYVVSTGYGRVSVPFSDKAITEITCHAKGVLEYWDSDIFTIVDIGGQDTKVITVKDGFVDDFIMNDKCSAGTGRFLEIMANRLGITLDELFEMAEKGDILKISSMCTVFAESEIIGLMGQGEKREDIAAGVVDSVCAKAQQLLERHGIQGDIILTGGLSNNKIFPVLLSKRMGKKINSYSKGIFAGAIGAANIGKLKGERK